ncbi:MAG: LemA family protein [Alphaproteobacteria bacterium]|nr:LemA family protein [Alphaproteobacteria bacterium]
MLYLVIAVVVIALFAIFLFNRLVTLRQAWRRAFADIDVQLKQRQDLVPNLVQTVKGYAAHESSVFTEVAAARSAAMRATGVAEKSAAEGALTGALGNLMAVAESYPELKASGNFLKLQEELSDLENKIAAARRFMNNAAAEYNSATQQFPALLIAGPLGFAPAQMFELDAAERAETRNAPKVSMA